MIKIAFSESGELFYILLAFLSTESSQLPSSLLACAIDRKKTSDELIPKMLIRCSRE